MSLAVVAPLRAWRRLLAYSPDQPRDDRGRFGEGTGGKVTDTPAFKAWFGDSKVVDAAGNPLVVYHGTQSNFEQFDPAAVKSRFPYSFGMYFTDRPPEADAYALGVDKLHPEPGGIIMPVYLSIQNPLVIRTSQPTASMEADLNRYEIMHQLVVARDKGTPYDGVIIRREHGDEYDGINAIVFEPTQIKSAIGNRGTFDRHDPRITASVRVTAPLRAWRELLASEGVVR